MGNSPQAETECESGTVVFFIFIVVHRGCTHAFVNFQPGLKLFSDCMVKFSARLAPTEPGNSVRAEILHVISP